MKRTTSIILVALLIFGVSGYVMAQDSTLQTLAVDVPGTGMVFMRLRVPHDGLSLLETRELIWERISDALRPGLEEGQLLDGQSVRVVIPEDETDDPQVFIADQLIIEVDEEHAALNNSSRAGLAEVWAANLELALDRWARINQPIQ